MYFGLALFLLFLVACLAGRFIRRVAEHYPKPPPVRRVEPEITYPEPYRMAPARKVEL